MTRKIALCLPLVYNFLLLAELNDKRRKKTLKYMVAVLKGNTSLALFKLDDLCARVYMPVQPIKENLLGPQAWVRRVRRIPYVQLNNSK